MRVEETFGISILDSQAATIRTVGDLCEFVIKETGARGQHAYISSAVFYRLRRAMIEGAAIERGAVRLGTPLTMLLPRASRRSQWKRMKDLSGMRIPELTYPGAVQLLFLVATLAITVSLLNLIAPLLRHLNAALLAFLFPLFAAAAFGALLKIGSFLATAFPAPCQEE